MQFFYSTKIHLRDTDATGVIFFSEQLRLALEAFEEFIQLGEFFKHNDFLLPIVHADVDFMQPLSVGDPIKISVRLGEVGNSSFTMKYEFFREEILAGKASIVHVTVDRKSQKKIPLPEALLKILKK